MKNVGLKEFEFDKYPPYVSFIRNFVRNMENHPTVVWLDNGVQTRHPWISVRCFLERESFFLTMIEKNQYITGRTILMIEYIFISHFL